jgi:hypothetical protein
MKRCFYFLLFIFSFTGSFSQNVGIGLTNPEQPLSVKGGVVIDQTNLNTGTASNTLRFGSSSGEAIGSSRVSGANQYGLDFYTQSQHRMTISNNGNVGIGLINPNTKLEIRGALGFSSTTKRWEMNYDSTNNYFYIDEYGAGRRLFIANGGNVGIGTGTPAAKLDVNGDINVETRILLNNLPGNAGQVLTSSGSGNAQWRNAAYGNSDRFLFISSFSSNRSAGAFSDTIKYNITYAKSGAITYNNGIFTVNKAGLYQFEGVFIPIAVASTATVNVGVSAFLIAGTSVRLIAGKMDYFSNTSSGPQYLKSFPFSIGLYFDAGSTFIFIPNFFTDAGLIYSGFDPAPLSINLISE